MKVGNTVKLKGHTNNLSMVVESVSGKEVTCMWMNGGEILRDTFIESCLTTITENLPQSNESLLLG